MDLKLAACNRADGRFARSVAAGASRTPGGCRMNADASARWRDVMLGAAQSDREVAVLYLGRDQETRCFVRGRLLAVSHAVVVVQRGTGSVGLSWDAVLEVRVLVARSDEPAAEVPR